MNNLYQTLADTVLAIHVSVVVFVVLGQGVVVAEAWWRFPPRFRKRR